MQDKMEVFGSLIQGFANACINLKIIAGYEVNSIVKNIVADNWYPIEHFIQLENLVLQTYDNPGPIMEKVGIETIFEWYQHGMGKNFIKSGVQFLHFQTSSKGYYRVVKGPPEKIGEFSLVELDEQKGTAIIHSTNPFNKDLERGVLIGGMKITGDLDYIDVNNTENKNYFNIKFY